MATEFKLPEVGEGITSGTVVGVLVSVGDTISEDQAVLELETDKAVVEVPSSVAGVVQEIRVSENEEASVGQVVLVVGEGDAPADAEPADTEPADTDEASAQEGDGSEEARPSAGTADAAAEEEAAEETVEEATDPASDKSSQTESVAQEEKDIDAAAKTDSTESAQKSPDSYDTPVDEKQPLPAAPSVRRLARELGVDLQQVKGSGIMGRISAEDVKMVAEGGRAAVRPKRSSTGRAASRPTAGLQQIRFRHPRADVRDSQSHGADDGERLEQRTDGDAVRQGRHRRVRGAPQTL